jgi:hypothetical protein
MKVLPAFVWVASQNFGSPSGLPENCPLNDFFTPSGDEWGLGVAWDKQVISR